MNENAHIAYCGVDCAVCPDYRDGKCPDCRRTRWPEGEICAPAACCGTKGIAWCGQCSDFPCGDMAAFYAKSESHRLAKRRMDALGRLRSVNLREAPRLRERAAAWFSSKWHVDEAAYLTCMDAYLRGEMELGWYLCLDGERIVGGLGVIENDFHDRKDLAPNICAVYTEETYRGLGVAGRLLDRAVEELRAAGITPVYLLTDHEGFYERYGWEYLCPAQGEFDEDPARMYIHR